jgi:hypothetical protein
MATDFARSGAVRPTRFSTATTMLDSPGLHESEPQNEGETRWSPLSSVQVASLAFGATIRGVKSLARKYRCHDKIELNTVGLSLRFGTRLWQWQLVATARPIGNDPTAYSRLEPVKDKPPPS